MNIAVTKTWFRVRATASIAGVGLLAVLLLSACTSALDGVPTAAGSAADSTASPSLPRSQSPTPAPTRATPTQAAPTEVPTATPTPVPYDGAVARFKIPRFEVDSSIESIGLLPSNQLDVPEDPLNTGWYDIYDKPGFGGNAVFSAHVDYWPDIKGPFYNLFELDPGDEVVVVMGDGREYTYEVFFKERYNVDTIPMGDLIWPANKSPSEEWVTLITCGGRFQAYEANGRGPGYYLDRDVVVARRTS